MKIFTLIFFTLILLFITITTNAWHLTGGEMSYECLGNNQYQITTRVYRDANTQQGSNFDNPILLSVFDGNGQVPNGFSNPLSIMYNNVSTITNNNSCTTAALGLEVATYVTTLSLPINASGYHISYQRCCLTNNIANVLNPNNYGMTLTTFISPYALTICNSSPEFNINVASTFCIGNPIMMDYSGSDIDGNNLIYSFSTPHDGLGQSNPAGAATPPPYGFVPFIPPFSNNQPLGASVTIDSLTGMISGVLNNAASYYFGVNVADYQNGVLLSETKRIFLINATACNSVTEDLDITVCKGENFSFGNNVYDSTGIYQISVFSSEGCENVINLDLNVATEITLFDSTIVHDDGNSSGSVSFQLMNNTPNYTYLWSNGDTISGINNVGFGIYTVTVTSDDGCSEIFEFEVLLDTKTRFIKNEQFEINISPNPVLAANIININIKAKESNELEISIYNMNGQRMETLHQRIQEGENQIESKLEFPKGVYYFLIKDKHNQLIERLPIVIQ